MRMFFGIAALFFATAFAQTAEAKCFDRYGFEQMPVAIADSDGVVVVDTPTGERLRVTGLPPGKELCRNLLFKSASKNCPLGNAHLDSARDPKYCKGVSKGNSCVHIACDEKRK